MTTRTLLHGASLKDIGKMSFFHRIFRKECERARSVSSLVTMFADLKLHLDDFCLDLSSYTKVLEQTKEVLDILRKYHSEEEIMNSKFDVDFEYHLDSDILHELQTDIRTITGTLDVFVPEFKEIEEGSTCGGTVLIVRTKEEVTLNDEALAIISATMYGADRAFLLDMFQGKLLHKHIDDEEDLFTDGRYQVIKAFLKGFLDSEHQQDLFEDPSWV